MKIKGTKVVEVTLNQIWEDKTWKPDTEEFYLYPNFSGKIFIAEGYMIELVFKD